jgi:predicted SnoaL-like aldol condensation-catalyzing enzyme
MKQTTESNNKDLVLEAFDTFFDKRNYAAAEKLWPPNYIQHSAHMPPGREGLVNLVKNAPPTLKYEHGPIVAEDDFVIVHGGFSRHGLEPLSWIAADIVRMKHGVVVEDWDVLQDEASRASSNSGLPMGDPHRSSRGQLGISGLQGNQSCFAEWHRACMRHPEIRGFSRLVVARHLSALPTTDLTARHHTLKDRFEQAVLCREMVSELAGARISGVRHVCHRRRSIAFGEHHCSARLDDLLA